MLDQVALTRPVVVHISQNLVYHTKLVVAGEDLLILRFPCLGVLLFYDLGVVFKNVGQSRRSERFFPEIIGL